MHVLVTGGSGFVGRAVVSELLKRGRAVTATTYPDLRPIPEADWIPWDATVSPLPDAPWDTLDAVIHLALPPNPLAVPEQTGPLFDTCVASTFHLLRKAASTGRIKRVVFISTGSSIGPRSAPAAESDREYRPVAFYGAAKACGEILADAFQKLVSTAVVRLYHPYGPGGDRFLINRLLRSVQEGREVFIDGEEGISLNPVWLEDAARGIDLAVASDARGIFHLGGRETVTLRQLLAMMGELAGAAPRTITRPVEVSESHACDMSRSAAELGYAPAVGLREGLRRLLETASRTA
jgi:nucleoside-diphosphate-sugar epimerase